MPKKQAEQKQSCAGAAHENIALLKNNAPRQGAPHNALSHSSLSAAR
jgi:hypothetical protein